MGIDSPLGTPRDEFLNDIQKALGKTTREPEVKYKQFNVTVDELEDRASKRIEQIQEITPSLIINLTTTATQGGWNVHHSPTMEKGTEFIHDLLQNKKVDRVVRSDEEIFEKLALENSLSDLNLDFATVSRKQAAPTDLRDLVFNADVGLTGVEYAISETGSIIVIPKEGLSRLVSLAPSIHIAVVQPHQIIETLDDLFMFRRLEHLRGNDIGSYMNFITGPSRTGDIEQVIVTGVHGPKEVYMLILG